MAEILAQPLPATRRDRTQNAATLAAVLRAPRLWLERMSHRRELAALDLRQMHDAGLDPETVRREASKPFWRA